MKLRLWKFEIEAVKNAKKKIRIKPIVSSCGDRCCLLVFSGEFRSNPVTIACDGRGSNSEMECLPVGWWRIFLWGILGWPECLWAKLIAEVFHLLNLVENTPEHHTTMTTTRKLFITMKKKKKSKNSISKRYPRGNGLIDHHPSSILQELRHQVQLSVLPAGL